MKEEGVVVKEEQTSVSDEVAPVLKEEQGSPMKKEEETTSEKTSVKLKLDFASLPPPPPPPAEPE